MKTSTLPGYRSEDEEAALLLKTTRTLKRWRLLQIGPPPTLVGETVYYSIAGTEKWLRSQEREWPQQRQRRRAA